MSIPYCGTPPLPGAVAWNLDPVLLAVLVAGGALLAWRGRGTALLGWVLAGLMLISPLCNLSVALFSARVAQHLVLIFLAAPLLAQGVALGRFGVGLPALCFGAALWAWHLPGPYLSSFDSHAVYWAMQLTLLGTATWLWGAISVAQPGSALLAVLGTAAQGGALGALLTLAQRPLFITAHTPGITAPWGLTPLEDQQIGGLLMWVPGGLLFVAASIVALTLALRPRPAV
ncbi:cytochrome c oxidase assembly protein [Rhodovarius crocodyli]|uniref:Cytochrome c oxidase assembly protein n=1 Tax=Rhodovarius crocodyli TaxID=1979269 RepID=A0A437MDR7_9PROT|nr:cytochrome c oxidase assembly protein [Rhodovarius crocodyli]RVT95807.1 cytochrome c oxidase assembly protein [Rhodovarius crocodyli]